MPRLAADRTTHLTPKEIVAEALRQFDEGPDEPSIRSLAAALRVAPAAIYHHFPSQAVIWQRAVEKVWREASREVVALEPHPFSADPVDVLVAVGLATRRTWMRHHRLSRYLAANPEGDPTFSTTLGLMASLFEGMGMSREEAGKAFHSYATFMVGAVLFAAANKTANEQLASAQLRSGRFHIEPSERVASHSSEETRAEIEEMMELAIQDPQRDEDLYVEGLRKLIESLGPRRGRRRTTRPKTVNLNGRPPSP